MSSTPQLLLEQISSHKKDIYKINNPNFCLIANPDLIADKPEDMSLPDYLIELSTLLRSEERDQISTSKNYLIFLKQLYAGKVKLSKDQIVFHAARHGHLRIITWVEEVMGSLEDHTGNDACSTAGMNNQLHVVKYLYSKGFKISISDHHTIVARGHLPIVKFLLEQDENFFQDYQTRNNINEYLVKDDALPVLQFYMELSKENTLEQRYVDWGARCEQIETLKFLASKDIYPTKAALERLLAHEKYLNGPLGKWVLEDKILERTTAVPDYYLGDQFLD